MSKRNNSVRTLALCLLLAAPALAAVASAQSKAYPNGRGGEITLPRGELAFADEVVSFKPGTGIDKGKAIAQKAVGAPDFKSGVSGAAVPLGCGGELVVRFTDNALTDMDGNDIYIFETAKDVEQADISVSKNGDKWIKIGRIAGDTTALDMKGKVKSSDTFRYLKIKDNKDACTKSRAGADIDAIAAIGSAKRTVFDNNVMFDQGKSKLKPGAAAALKDLAEDIKGQEKVRVVIEGHTDSTGSDALNVDLSRARAQAVGNFLIDNGVSRQSVDTVGYGEAEPLVPNTTAANRAKNRRVEALVIAG
jgi:outer membrane protein OmpA-like peptidoglycan-associated protein